MRNAGRTSDQFGRLIYPIILLYANVSWDPAEVDFPAYQSRPGVAAYRKEIVPTLKVRLNATKGQLYPGELRGEVRGFH